MKEFLNKTTLSIIITQLISSGNCFAQISAGEAKVEQVIKKEVVVKKKNVNFDLKELALPSEVSNISKKGGAIYYSPAIKGKVLMPVNIWGAISRPGLHFVPINTNIIKGLSFAGGPSSTADLSNIKLTRLNESKVVESEFDLGAGGGEREYTTVLQPGDTLFIKKDTWSENRNYYTSLVGVIATILSSVLLYRQIDRN